MQESEFRSFEVYCITLSAHFVKKKTLKSNIIYNSASRIITRHVFTSAEIMAFALRHGLKNRYTHYNWDVRFVLRNFFLLYKKINEYQEVAQWEVDNLAFVLTFRKSVAHA